MEIDSTLKRWVEYCLCESAMELYPKLKTNSTNFRSFCERLRESIMNENLGKRDVKVLKFITYRAHREYRLKNGEIDIICADFFIDRRWERYIRAIELMDGINWRL